MAGSTAPVAGVSPASVSGPTLPASTQTAVEGTPMIRSAELDRYLAAHRQYASGAMQVAPGGAVRNAAATAPGR